MGSALVTTLLALWLSAASGALPARAEEPQQPAAEATTPTAVPQASTQVAPAAPGSEAGGCLDRAIDALQARYERVRDLRARFVQTTRQAHVGAIEPEPVTSSGHMVVAKPARMRWVYEKPEESVVVSDGKSLWIYDPGFHEAQRLPVGEGYLSGAAVQFLLGEGDLRRDFEISLVSCDAHRAELELRPREPASYEKLRVVVDPTTGALSSTRVDDLFGNETLVELRDLETNVDPDPATFEFEPPAGVSVIELDPATVRP